MRRFATNVLSRKSDLHLKIWSAIIDIRALKMDPRKVITSEPDAGRSEVVDETQSPLLHPRFRNRADAQLDRPKPIGFVPNRCRVASNP